MKIASLLTASLLILVLSGPASAAHHKCDKGHKGANRPSFAQVDADGSGGISEQELMEFRGKRMAERAKEGRQMKNAGNAPAFADIDTDGDGAISQEEFAAHQDGHGCKCGGHRGKRHGDDKERGGCPRKKSEQKSEAA